MNNELTHHGVLGMKWGVRRYQNKDGTRTALSKKRSKEEPGGLKGIIKRKEESRSVENRAKKYKNLSDEMAYKVAKGEQAASRYLAYTGGTLIAQTVVPTFMKYQNKKTISFDHVGDKVFTADNIKRVAIGGLINVSYLTLRDALRKKKAEKNS